MNVNDYIRGLADEELKQELYRRNDEKRRALREQMQRDYDARMKVREGEVREFCEGIGITYEQFCEVEGYLEDESDRECNRW